MALITAEKNPEVEIWTRVESGYAYLRHDEVAGRLILAHCLGSNVGAQVHIVESYKGSVYETDSDELRSLINQETLHTVLLPWFKIDLPVHRDNGSEAALTIFHRPDIVINKTNIPIDLCE